LRGRISSFSPNRGDGMFSSAEGDFYFHCVVIADGSRTIDIGIEAQATRAVGHLGRDEVANVKPLA